MIRLHGFARSSASYRVRIALNLKGLRYEQRSWSLRDGEHRGDEYSRINPQQLVPALEIDGQVLTQSLAIVEYLDERYPTPALLPEDCNGRARVRSLALAIACDIHPLNNLRVLRYLEERMGAETGSRDAWYQHWVREGFRGIEQLIADSGSGKFCHGDAPTLADVCLVPQVYNARRFNVDLEDFPRIVNIAAECDALQAFAAASESPGSRSLSSE